MTEIEADRLQRGLAAWALAEPSCRALAAVGSWARGRARPDSDLDLVALVAPRDRWTAEDGWLREVLRGLGFATETSQIETHGVAVSWRLWLAGGAELELTLVDPSWASVDPLDPGTRRVAGDGLAVLTDKDGSLQALLAAL
jgi:hypothetical protein